MLSAAVAIPATGPVGGATDIALATHRAGAIAVVTTGPQTVAVTSIESAGDLLGIKKRIDAAEIAKIAFH